jgi:hypothetical protein
MNKAAPRRTARSLWHSLVRWIGLALLAYCGSYFLITRTVSPSKACHELGRTQVVFRFLPRCLWTMDDEKLLRGVERALYLLYYPLVRFEKVAGMRMHENDYVDECWKRHLRPKELRPWD